MFEQRSKQHELMDDATLEDEALKENLTELEIYNNWLGGRSTLLNALNRIYQKYKTYVDANEILITDVGCGGGDLLEAMDEWADRKNIEAKLLGVDVNPFIIEYAKYRVVNKEHYEFRIIDATQEFPLIKPDVVSLNSVCHHFSDHQLIQLLKNLRQQTRLAIIINDLQRHWITYFAFKWLTRLLGFSYLAQYDAPLSVLRAFRKHELVKILKSAGIQHYEIHKTWFLRWQIIIWFGI